jgi:peptidoglycan LD-endopeptidase CwlK
MASRDLNDLRPDVRELAVKHIAACAADGIELLVYCTYRSDEEQNAAYAVGRSLPGKIITNLRGGQSKHNNKNKEGKPASLAYDCVPCISGKPIWDNDKMYLRVGQIGEALGLIWSGRWTGKLREKAHFEV